MPAPTSDRPPHYIRQWRRHRCLTLEQLSERIGMTHQNLGKIERFKVPYSETLLDHLSEELRTDKASLIMRDPSEPDGIWSIWEQLGVVERAQLVEIGKALKRTGTTS